eukprot:4975413-Pleurochrysis_carterae.AAC.1
MRALADAEDHSVLTCCMLRKCRFCCLLIRRFEVEGAKVRVASLLWRGWLGWPEPPTSAFYVVLTYFCCWRVPSAARRAVRPRVHRAYPKAAHATRRRDRHPDRDLRPGDARRRRGAAGEQADVQADALVDAAHAF